MDIDYYVSMDFSNRCNASCVMCYFSLDGFKPKGRNMTLDEFKVCADKLSPLKGTLALSCAFEPLIHKDIIPILLYTKVLSNWNIRLNTNGILLNKQIIEALLNSSVNEIVVSMDAADDDLNYRIRQNRYSARIIEQLQYLAKMKQSSGNKLKCTIRMTLMKANLHELPKMVELTAKAGAEKFSVKHLLPIEGCKWDDKPIDEQSCLLIPEKTSEVFELTKNKAKEMGVEIDLPSPFAKDISKLVLKCPYSEGGFHLYSDGTVYPCVWLTADKPYGNMITDSLDFIYENSKTGEISKSFKSKNLSNQCLNCLKDSQTVEMKTVNNAIKRLMY